jgi:hypothetical protein
LRIGGAAQRMYQVATSRHQNIKCLNSRLQHSDAPSAANRCAENILRRLPDLGIPRDNGAVLKALRYSAQNGSPPPHSLNIPLERLFAESKFGNRRKQFWPRQSWNQTDTLIAR